MVKVSSIAALVPTIISALVDPGSCMHISSKSISRRSALGDSVAGGASILISLAPRAAIAAASSKTPIADRINAASLTEPPPSMGSELKGIDNMYYPSWMAGEWEVTQTLESAETPLGLKFVGGPAGSEAIASASMKEQRRQLGVPVKLRLRWVKTKFGVAEDRIFNGRERLDGFAGRNVVASVEYANVGGSNRAAVLTFGGTEDDPLQTTMVRFRGPAAQKNFLVSHGEGYDAENGNKWACFEVLRSIFALTNQNTAPPVTTDTENIWAFERIDDENISAQLRIASYLNAQSDSLYFEARNRAVSFADYTLQLKKVSS